MNLIAFSIWGRNPKFMLGALSNIQLAAIHYPGWVCRVYCGTDVPEPHLTQLRDAGFQVYQRGARMGLHDGLFWRFEPSFDKGVEIFLSRDCDSRINPREAAAVNEWLASGKRLHTMRDHYEHIVPVLGGMWGCRHWPEFESLLGKWKKIGNMGDDQDFLKEAVWPLVRDNDSMAHDLYPVDTTVETPRGHFRYKPVEFFGKHDVRPFPEHAPLCPSAHGEFVGSRVWT